MKPEVWLCVGRVPEVVVQAQAEGLEWLGEAARRRLPGFGSAVRRAQFIAGRWMLQILLSKRFGTTMSELASITAELDQPPRLAGLHLAVSHSGEWLACAASRVEIGIDIQVPRPRCDRTDLIEFICTPRERQRVVCADADLERERLDTLWALKEAWIKRPARGLGLLDMSRLETQPASAAQSNARAWKGPGFTLALAVPAETIVRWHEPAPVDCLSPDHWRTDRVWNA